MDILRVESISKSYGSKKALEDVSFTLRAASTSALLGPSGCGKSTLLGIIAGLEQPDSGQVFWQGNSLAGVPIHARGFGLMFQDFALFPHYNVYNNIAFGLKMLRQPKEQIDQRVTEVLELVGLPGFEKRDVNTLSGGESQRVALARSLAPRPSLLMLDEPLGSLDRALRERLTLDLRQILRISQQTALYVTHDQEEAFVIAEQVIVMNQGRVMQSGAPQEIFLRPACRFVASFLGLNNQLPGVIHSRQAMARVETPLGAFELPPIQAAGDVTVLLRPDKIELGTGKAAQLSGVVQDSTFRGDSSKLVIDFEGYNFSFSFPSTTALPQKGERVTISFEPAEALQVFPEKCEQG